MARRRGRWVSLRVGGPSPQARGVGQGLTPRTQKRSKARAAKGVEVTEEGGQKAKPCVPMNDETVLGAKLVYLDNVRLGGVTCSALSTEPARRRMGPIDQMLDDQAGGFCGRQLRQRQDGLEQLAHVSH